MTSNLRSILDTNKLTGSNFMDWFRTLKIVLKYEDIDYVIDEDIPKTPALDVYGEQELTYHQHVKDDKKATCIMLASMSCGDNMRP